MSQASVEQALGRMVIDRQFRQAVKADAKKALAGMGLESNEIEGLSQVDHDNIDKAFSGLDQRITKIMLPFRRG